MSTLQLLVKGYESTARKLSASATEFDDILRRLVEARQWFLDVDRALAIDPVTNDAGLKDVHDAVVLWYAGARFFLDRIKSFGTAGEFLPSAAAYYRAYHEGPVTSLTRRKHVAARTELAAGGVSKGLDFRDALRTAG